MQLVATYETTHKCVMVPIDVYEKLVLFKREGEALGDFVKEAFYFYLEQNPRPARPIPPPRVEEIKLLPDTIDTERFFEIANASDPDPESLVNYWIKRKTRDKFNKLRMPGETYENIMDRVVDYYMERKPQVVLKVAPPPEVRFNPNLTYLKSAIHESLENVLRPYEGPRLIQHTQRPMINIRGTPMYEVWYNGYAYTLAKKMTVTTIVDLLNKNLIQNKW